MDENGEKHEQNAAQKMFNTLRTEATIGQHPHSIKRFCNESP